jgi:hypothetical protein
MQQQSTEFQTAGMMSAMYYLGRLDGRAPKADIESMLASQVSSMTGEDYSQEAKRCGTTLQGRGAQMQQIGQNLIRRGQELQNKPVDSGPASNKVRK